MAYLAYVLEEPSRDVLLGTFIPNFPDVKAHHITIQYPISFFEMMKYWVIMFFAESVKVRVVNYLCDDSLETLQVSVNGAYYRQDGKAYHITLSLDKSKGREAVQSNDLFQHGHLIPVGIPIELYAKLRVCF